MNNQLSFFNNKSHNEKYYVYILVNSLNNDIFYVGKGSGNRRDQHLIEFQKIIENQNIEITNFKEIRDKRKYNNYKKMRLFFEIYINGGEIISKIVYPNLSESNSYKIEQLLIFILKRKIEYLCTHKINGKRKQYLIKFTGKLINKSIGGESKGKKVYKEFTNPSLLLENYNNIQEIIENSEFIDDLRKRKFSNITELENFSTILDYIKNQKKIIEKEIYDFKSGII
jgi:hypothetical protein